MRTTPEKVRAIIKLDTDLSIDPFIVAANALTDYCVSRDTGNRLTTQLQETLEQYIAAYLCALKDQQYANKNTGAASAQFQTGLRGQGAFQANDWGATAMMLDVTGTLTAINNGVVRTWMIHLGDSACYNPWDSVCVACAACFC